MYLKIVAMYLNSDIMYILQILKNNVNVEIGKAMYLKI